MDEVCDQKPGGLSSPFPSRSQARDLSPPGLVQNQAPPFSPEVQPKAQERTQSRNQLSNMRSLLGISFKCLGSFFEVLG